MKKIYFCLNYIDVPDICLTYEETEQDLIKGKECIYTTSMSHFSFDLIEQGYDIYLCYQDKKVKIEPHMDLSGNGEPCKDLRFGHNIFKMFKAGIFNPLIGYLNKEIKDYFNNQPIITRSKGIDYQLIPSGEELIAKAYKDSEESGREYKKIVDYVESILENQRSNYE